MIKPFKTMAREHLANTVLKEKTEDLKKVHQKTSFQQCCAVRL